MGKLADGMDAVTLGKSSLVVREEYDMVLYKTAEYPLDVALSRGYQALKEGGKFVILHNQNSLIINQWSEYRDYALTMFVLESEKKNDITLIKTKEVK